MCISIALPEAGLLSRFFSNVRSNVRPAAQRLLVAAGVALAGFGAFAQDIDPPGRVARLNLMQGNVSQLPAGENDWSQAEINRPLTTGDRLRTDPGARVELHSGSTAVRLDGAASLDISQLDDNTTRLTLSEGTLNLRVRNLYPGEQIEIDTPNLALTVQQPGSFRLEVDPRFGTTRVSARSGAATVYGENAESVPITANGQVLAFAARNLSQAGLAAPIQTDGFDQWADARDRAEDQSISARYVSRDMPGYQQLDSFGDWQNDATYGAVWLPRVTVAEWAPYRYGQWRWIAPWGWTWVDDAPWGFAPFHYGRWAQIGPRWAWVPGPRGPRPTYAPALVGFLGGQPGRADWNVHAGPDRRPGPGIGWFPLAPGEAWRPGFRASPSYLGGINRDDRRDDRRDGRDSRGPRGDDRPYHFQGRPNAVTAMPQADFGRGPAWRQNRPNLRDGDLAGAQLLQAPPMPALRPGTRPDFGGRRPEAGGKDHPNWNNAARSQAEQNLRAQTQAEEARQRQQDALQRPSLERQAQQDRLSQEGQRRQVEQLQRQQERQQPWQQQQQQQRDFGRNQIDPAGPRVQQQQAQQAQQAQQLQQQQRDQRLQQERAQHERQQADRTQREQMQRQQFQQQREQQNQAEQQRARQQAQQAQQAEQLRREQQGQQERMQRDVAQREQIQRQQQQQQQQQQQRQQQQQMQQQHQQNQVDPRGLRGRVQQAQPEQPGEPGRPGLRQQIMNRDQR